jgi:hypothetical protein
MTRDVEGEKRLLDNRRLVEQMETFYRANGQVRVLAVEAGVSPKTLYRHLSGEAIQIRRHNAVQIEQALMRLQPPQP